MIRPFLALALAGLTCLTALPRTSSAQIVIGNPFGEIYLTADPGDRIESNDVDEGFTSFDFHVLVQVDFTDDGRPAENSSNGLSGWEAEVLVPMEITVTNRALFPAASTNSGSDDNFIVTTGSTVLAQDTPFALVTYSAQVNMAMVPEDLIITLGPSTPNAGSTNTPNWVEAANGSYHPFPTFDSRFVVNCVNETECGGDISEPLGHLYLSAEPGDRVPFNEDLAAFGSFNMHLIAEVDFADLGRGEENVSNGIFAWEASLNIPTGITVAGVSFQPLGSLNIGNSTNYIVGTGGFILANLTPYALVEIQCFLLTDPAPSDLVVTLDAAVPSSLDAGVPVWISQIQGDTHPFATAVENRFVVNCAAEPECDTTPVAMSGAEATFRGDAVVVRWHAAGPDPTFRVLRGRDLGPVREIGVDLGSPSAGMFTFTDRDVSYSSNYVYRIELLKDDRVEDAREITITTPRPTDVRLWQNVPNPFNPSTTISYLLPTEGPVSLDVFDTRGRWVANLVDAHQSAGGHEVTWNGQDASGRGVGSGVYYYRLRTASRELTRQMLLLR